MKHLLIAFILLLPCLPGCKSLTQKNIIGKWKGTGEETLGKSKKVNKFKLELEFTGDGHFTETNFDITNGNPYPPVALSYMIEGDSIVWINNVGNKLLIKSAIQFISEGFLSYKTLYVDNTVTYTLDKVSN